MPALSNQASFYLALPEILLALGALLVLFLGLLRPQLSRWTAAAVTVVVALAALVATPLTAPDAPRGLFGGLTARDPFGDFFRVVACLATVMVALLATRARDTIDDRERDREAPEFFALLLTAALGVVLMASATDMLLAYLGLELVSMMSYILAGFTRGQRRSAEAALKYVIYGGVASAALLYGMSLVYGFTGQTNLQAAITALRAAPASLAFAALALCLAGLGYKVAVVPFHMWCPDVYEGAPTPVAAFLSVAPKAGGFALVLRFFGGSDPSPGVVLGQQASVWSLLVLVLAVMTMTLGNLSALGQTNVKRLLAYSAIAHAGYVFLGVAIGAPAGHLAILFYLGVYLFMSLGAFAVVVAVQGSEGGIAGGGDTLAAFAGLGRRQPLAALTMTVILFALAGLPPTGGFVAKYYMFSALVAHGRQLGEGMFLVAALIAVLNSVISLYYYARVVRAMYLDPSGEAPPWRLPAPLALVLLAALIPTVALGIYWSPLDDLVRASLVTWAPPLPGGR